MKILRIATILNLLLFSLITEAGVAPPDPGGDPSSGGGGSLGGGAPIGDGWPFLLLMVIVYLAYKLYYQKFKKAFSGLESLED